MGLARERPPQPTTVEHLAYESSFTVWGHEVVLERDELAPTVLAIGPAVCTLRAELGGRGRITLPGGEVREVEVTAELARPMP